MYGSFTNQTINMRYDVWASIDFTNFSTSYFQFTIPLPHRSIIKEEPKLFYRLTHTLPQTNSNFMWVSISLNDRMIYLLWYRSHSLPTLFSAFVYHLLCYLYWKSTLGNENSKRKVIMKSCSGTVVAKKFFVFFW